MANSSLLSPGDAQALNLTELVQISAASIVSRTVIQTPKMKTVLFGFDSDQELTLHTSQRRALIQVLTGSGEFFYGETWHRLEAGTLLHLPPNHPHAVKAAHGSFTMLLTLVANE